MNQHQTTAIELLNRLDRLPIWPYPRKVLLVIGIGFFFSFFDIVTIGLALPLIEKQMHVSIEVATWAITSSLIGYIIGSFLDSRISDLFGRKLALCLSIAFFSIGTLCCALSTTIGRIIFWRLITGMGIGSEIVGISTYMAEIAPAHYRGKITSWAIASGMFGFAIVPFIALALVPNFAWGWRALFIIGAVGGIVIFFMRRHIPESPRWLIAKGNIAAAESIISNAEDYAQKKFQHALPTVPILYTQPPTSMSLLDVVRTFYRWRILLFAAIWFIYYIGNYAWLTLATNLFIKHGFKLPQSLIFVAIASLGFIMGSVLAAYLSDKFERKYLTATIALIWALSLLIIGWFPSNVTIVICGFIATTTIAMIVPILYTYTAENFPTSVRATCVSVTDGFGHIGGAFCGQIIFTIYNLFSNPLRSFAAAFTGMAISGLITALLLFFGIKMTRKQLI